MNILFYFIIILSIVGCSSNESESVEENNDQTLIRQNEEAKDTDVVTTNQDKTFGITLAEYEKRVDLLSKKLGLYDENEPAPTPIVVEKGPINDAFMDKFTEDVGMVGTIDKNGSIKELTCIMDKAFQSELNVTTIAAASAMNAVLLNPELDFYQSMEFFSGLIQEANDEFENTGSSEKREVIKDVEYVIVITDHNIIRVTLVPA